MKIFKRNEAEMAISEGELVSLTSDMADMHADRYPAMVEAAEQWRETEAPRNLSRRGFLATASAFVGGGLVLAAAGPVAASTRAGSLGLSPAEARRALAGVPVDVQVAALAASLENLAVGTYGAALKAAKAGKLGAVPPAIATFATTASAQHADHAAAWNALVKAAGYKAITVSDPVVAKLVDTQFAKVKNVVGVAELALELEMAAAATYLEALGAVSSTKAIQVAASIQPVEMQHAAILNFVLGKYPVPASFSTLAGARPLSDLSSFSGSIAKA